jgi:hypothetical protein
MSTTRIDSIKKTKLLAFTTLYTAFSIETNPADSAQLLTLMPQTKGIHISQNTVLNNVKLEQLYITEEGTNLGWIIRVGNSVIAVDAGGAWIRILERVIDNSIDSTVEYHNSGSDKDQIMRIGNTYFQYYNNAGIGKGSIRSIGNLYFQYYNTGSLENGRIMSIGNLYFRYYNFGVNGIKLQSIGNLYLTYNSNGKLQRISGSQPGVGIQTLSISQWRVIIGVPEPEPSLYNKLK